jgi:hypothetical protein
MERLGKREENFQREKKDRETGEEAERNNRTKRSRSRRWAWGED